MVKELLLSALLLANPISYDEGEQEIETPETEETVETSEDEETVETSEDEENKVKIKDEDGNEYWIDFSKINWDKLDVSSIDFSNVDTEQLTQIVTDVFADAISPDLIALIGSIAGWVIIILGLLVKTYKEKKKAGYTANEVTDNIMNKLDEALESKMVTTIDSKITDKLAELVKDNKLTNSAVKKLVEATALAQQNDPSAKKAIIELLTETGVLKEEVAEKVEKVIDNLVTTKEETIAKIEELQVEEKTEEQLLSEAIQGK